MFILFLSTPFAAKFRLKSLKIVKRVKTTTAIVFIIKVGSFVLRQLSFTHRMNV